MMLTYLKQENIKKHQQQSIVDSYSHRSNIDLEFVEF